MPGGGDGRRGKCPDDMALVCCLADQDFAASSAGHTEFIYQLVVDAYRARWGSDCVRRYTGATRGRTGRHAATLVAVGLGCLGPGTPARKGTGGERHGRLIGRRGTRGSRVPDTQRKRLGREALLL